MWRDFLRGRRIVWAEVRSVMRKMERRYDLDWLRVIGMAGVFLFHVSQYLNQWGWHIKDPYPSEGITHISWLLNQWIMPLFFVISGVSASFALQARSNGAYLKERAVRLGWPILLGILILSPPQVFIERVTQGEFQGTFGEFLVPHYFQGVYGFDGNFALIPLHLWYLLVLLLFSLITLPLFRQQKGGGRAERRSVWDNPSMQPVLLVALMLPLVWLHVTLDRESIGTRDLGGWNLFVYLTLFCYGYFLFRKKGMRDAIRRYGRYGWLVAAGIAVTVLWGMGLKAYYAPENQWLAGTLSVAFMWSVLLGLFDLCERFLNRRNAALAYWNRAVMPFYVLHQPVIVIAAYVIFWRWDLPAPLEYLLLAGVSFAGIMLLYRFVVQKVSWLQPLFGVKATKNFYVVKK